MSTSLTFGDVFRYKEKEYIYLAKSEEVIYAAQILTEEHTRQVNTLFNVREAQGKTFDLTVNVLYCFVMLQTPSYKNRAAHFAETGRDEFGIYIEKLTTTLSDVDLKCIKGEIMSKKSISLELKELVKNLVI